MRDPYESLAVPRSATAADIKKSFRELAKRLHPDANNNDPKAAILFAELNAAHEILGDEEKRRAFDQGEIDAEGKPSRRAIARRPKPSMSHIVTSLMAVMVMLFVTAMLIMRGLSPDENVDVTGEGEDRVSSTIEAKGEHAPAAQPEQPIPASQSTPRLILQQNVSYAAAADSVPVSIQISGQPDGLALEISGLASGTTISSGRRLGGGGWRLLAADVGNATIQPPPGFSGSMDLAVELRSIDDTVVDRGSLHLEWLQKPAVAAEPMASADATPASESSTENAPATPRPTDQTAVQDATDTHRDHERIDLLIGQSEKFVAAGDVEAAHTLLQSTADAHNARAAQGRLKLLSARAAEAKRHILHRASVTHEPTQAQMPPADPYGVYVAGTRVGSDPDPNIRTQLLRDDAGRELRTMPNGAAEHPD
jgi:curved DNA-binding protein CbpA